jgi:hypothetical protein
MRKLLVMGFLLFTVSSRADTHDDLVHIAAHVGLSYVATTLSYGILKKLNVEKDNAIIYAMCAALAAGIAYKVAEGGNDYLPATAKNSLGIVGAAIAIKGLDF